MDQSVPSKARRAATMARSMSSAEASATWPSSSSVAGFVLTNVLPPLASTSFPSMSILGSGFTLVVMGTGLSPPASDDTGGGRVACPALRVAAPSSRR